MSMKFLLVRSHAAMLHTMNVHPDTNTAVGGTAGLRADVFDIRDISLTFPNSNSTANNVLGTSTASTMVNPPAPY